MDYSDAYLVVPLNKKRILTMLGGGLLFVLLGFSFIYLTKSDPVSYDPGLFYFAAFTCIPFGAICAAYYLIKLFDRKPGLVLLKNGIIDNSSAVGFKFLPYNEIDHISKGGFIFVYLKDPEKFLKSQPFLKRSLMRINFRKFKAPAVITDNILSHSLSEIVKVLVAQAHIPLKDFPKESDGV